jgi:predicted phosphohydrolase
MKVFGPAWENYHQKIQDNWQRIVKDEDLVLIPGDISWAMHLHEALIDLEFIDKLKGQKILIRGNHDYWWPTLSKLEKLPFKTIRYIHNNALSFHGVGICGTRLWDSHEYSFGQYVDFKENPHAKEKVPSDNERIFENELRRLEMSIAALPQDSKIKIAMVHYPPIGKDLKQSRCSKLFEENGITQVCFGHLHNLKQKLNPYGSARGVTYHFCAADEVDFTPQKMLTF